MSCRIRKKNQIRPKTEVWKDISGFEGMYQVSSVGRVRSLSRYINRKDGYKQFHKGKILKATLSTNGYYMIHLGRDSIYTVHRLVAEAFIPNPDNLPCVNHKDENKLNNTVDNLEWITSRDNLLYSNVWKRAVKTRNNLVGENNPFYGKHHTDEIKELCGRATRGKIFVNDGSKEIAINPDELNSYLERGYKRGYIRNVKTK